MMLHRWISMFILLLPTTSILCSCGPELEYESWEPIDYYSVYMGMALPTGSIRTDATELQSFFGDRMPDIVDPIILMTGMIATMAEIAGQESLEESSDTDVWDFDADAGTTQTPSSTMTKVIKTGTYLYLEIACPGVSGGNGIGKNFNSGVIRVDSADLSDFSLRNVVLGAHLLLTFDDCMTPSGIIDTAGAAFLSNNPTSLIVDLVPFGFNRGGIRVTSAYLEQAGASLLITARDRGTYRLDIVFDEPRIEVSLVGWDGKIECHFDLNGRVFNGCEPQ